MPPSGTVASCLAAAGSMMLRSRSPWLVATRSGFADSGIAEAFIISRVKGRTRQNARIIRYRYAGIGLFIAGELYPRTGSLWQRWRRKVVEGEAETSSVDAHPQLAVLHQIVETNDRRGKTCGGCYAQRPARAEDVRDPT